jgi:hypothetical protein
MQNPYAAPVADPSAPMPQAGQYGPEDWTIGELISVGWAATMRAPLPLIGGFFLVLVINQAVSSLGQSLLGGGDASNPMAAVGASLLLLPVTLALSVYLTVGQTRVALAAARDEPIEFSTFFSGANRLLPGLLLLIVVGLGVMFGMLFLIIPGIIVALGWALVFNLLADTDLGVGEMLSESWEATKGQRLRIFAFYLVCGLVVLAGLLALVVGVLVALPVIAIAQAELYQRLTGRTGEQPAGAY